MTNKRLGVAALVCLIASGVPFWLWKNYIVRGPAIHTLIWLFEALYALALGLALVLGVRLTLRASRSWVARGLLVTVLLGSVAYALLMAGLAMDFIGQ